MKERNRLRSYGPWVVSVIALFVAMTSSAGALKGKDTVDSGDIKPGAVHTGDIAKYGVNTPDVAPSAVEGYQVAQYTLTGGNLKRGSVGAGELGDLRTVFGDLKALGVGADVTSGAATCPVGTRLISGGANLSGNSAALMSSYPDPANNGNNPKTWIVQGHLLQAATGPGFMAVYALCLGD